MLKKKYNGRMVLIIAIAVFAASMMILWYLEHKYHFGAAKNTIIVVVCAAITSLLAIRITVWRKAEIVVQPSDYPPEAINPIQAGCIIDDVVNARDIAAAFFYMANKGYFDINEYELKKFEFTQGKYPDNEEKSIKYIYKALFGDKSATKTSENPDDSSLNNKQTVRLLDVADRLIEVVNKIQLNTYNGIASRRNKEIADMTGKVIGFKESLLANRNEKAQSLVDDNPNYVYDVLSYAYAFSITAKLCRNFEPVAIDMPTWYHPYGIADDYVFDVLIYNSMLRNLPEQLKHEVFDKTIDTYPSTTTINRATQ